MNLGSNLPKNVYWLSPEYIQFSDPLKSAKNPMAILDNGSLDWDRTVALDLQPNGWPVIGQEWGLQYADGSVFRFSGAQRPPSEPITPTFRPEFIATLKDRKIIRFMDNQMTNEPRGGDGRKPPTWENRTRKDQITQTCSTSHGNNYGVALEYMLELAEETNCAAWFCIHDQADENYIREFAKMCQASSAKGFILENGNENWNPQFASYERAYKSGGAAYGIDVSEETGKKNRARAAYFWNGWRTILIAKIFNEEFSGDDTRLHVTLGAGRKQTNSWRDPLGMTYPDGSRLKDWIHSISIASYFGGYLGNMGSRTHKSRNINPDTMTVDTVIDECLWALDDLKNRIEFVREDVRKYYYGDAIGLTVEESPYIPVLAYEAGHHLKVARLRDNAAEDHVSAVFAEAVRDPRMRGIYTQMLNDWHAVMGDETDVCLFTGPGIPYGSRGNYFSLEPGAASWQGVEDWLGIIRADNGNVAVTIGGTIDEPVVVDGEGEPVVGPEPIGEEWVDPNGEPKPTLESLLNLIFDTQGLIRDQSTQVGDLITSQRSLTNSLDKLLDRIIALEAFQSRLKSALEE